MKILCFDSKFGFHPFPGQLRGAGDPLLFAEAEMPGPGWRTGELPQKYAEKADQGHSEPNSPRGQFIFQVVLASFLVPTLAYQL